MRTTPKLLHWLLLGLLFGLPAISIGEVLSANNPVPPITNPVDRAQHQITEYLANLANLHCTESVIQQKLGSNGHVEATERAKYDYLIMMSGSGDEFQLNESRIEASKERHKAPPASMLVSNGIATVLLVFHPYYRDSFAFETGPEEMVDGRPAVPVHFTHIAGRRTPMALALRNREYPLELQGTAWIDKQSGEVAKISANLLHDMSDVGLRSMHIEVDYKPATPGITPTSTTLPAVAVVDVTTPRQHWHNTHMFGDYKSFATGAEQDPNVKIHPDTTTPDGADTPPASPPTPKEKP
jgi:hypothetical protein